MKLYRSIPITECGEPLRAIPKDAFAFFEPHPYVAAGAPYGETSPWMLRRGVLDALLKAQTQLIARHSGWKIKLFDAYRPNAVQAYMVEQEFTLQAKAANLNPSALSEADHALLAKKVFRLWGTPSEDPATPPPHSTGAAVDCTLVNETGDERFMGSPIDENSDRSNPDHFAAAADASGKEAHANRQYLKSLLEAVGFMQHDTEWWHFSKGDQCWAYFSRERGLDAEAKAIYGRASLVENGILAL